MTSDRGSLPNRPDATEGTVFTHYRGTGPRNSMPPGPGRRIDRGTRVYAEARAKWASVVARIRELREQRRPVLIGTGTVATAQHLSTLLRGCEIPHRVLSARQVSRRGGEVRCETSGERVLLAGRARLYMAGTILLP